MCWVGIMGLLSNFGLAVPSLRYFRDGQRSEPFIHFVPATQPNPATAGILGVGEERAVLPAPLRKRLYRPPDDRIAREKHAPALDVAVPQRLLGDQTAEGAAHHLRPDLAARGGEP